MQSLLLCRENIDREQSRRIRGSQASQNSTLVFSYLCSFYPTSHTPATAHNLQLNTKDSSSQRSVVHALHLYLL